VDSPEKAGICSFKLSILQGDKSSVNLEKEPEWKKRIPRRPGTNQVRAFIYQCRELPAADDDGSSDPFI